MRIVLCYPVESRHFEKISQSMPGADVVDAGQERVAQELLAADIFCGHAKVPVDWDRVVEQGRLKWIQSSAAGMDHCLVPAVIESDIVVTSASGVLADQVAEHAIALMTAWTRGLPVFFRAQQQKEFIRRPTRDLTRATVGIVGLGGVGRRLAQLLAAFQCRVLAVDLFPVDKPSYVDSLAPADRLDEMLPLLDFLVLCAPLNVQTRNMLDAQRMAKMNPGALLVNVARGALVVHDDLVAALRNRQLAGAVMDVTEPEPLPVDSPLWAMPNVIVTPHVGGQAAWRSDLTTDLFCRNLVRWQRNQPLINQLSDKRLGFPVRGRVPLWDEITGSEGT